MCDLVNLNEKNGKWNFGISQKAKKTIIDFNCQNAVNIPLSIIANLLGVSYYTQDLTNIMKELEMLVCVISNMQIYIRNNCLVFKKNNCVVADILCLYAGIIMKYEKESPFVFVFSKIPNKKCDTQKVTFKLTGYITNHTNYISLEQGECLLKDWKNIPDAYLQNKLYLRTYMLNNISQKIFVEPWNYGFFVLRNDDISDSSLKQLAFQTMKKLGIETFERALYIINETIQRFSTGITKTFEPLRDVKKHEYVAPIPFLFFDKKNFVSRTHYIIPILDPDNKCIIGGL